MHERPLGLESWRLRATLADEVNLIPCIKLLGVK
jgi:hypothetical protein